MPVTSNQPVVVPAVGSQTYDQWRQVESRESWPDPRGPLVVTLICRRCRPLADGSLEDMSVEQQDAINAQQLAAWQAMPDITTTETQPVLDDQGKPTVDANGAPVTQEVQLTSRPPQPARFSRDLQIYRANLLDDLGTPVIAQTFAAKLAAIQYFVNEDGK